MEQENISAVQLVKLRIIDLSLLFVVIDVYMYLHLYEPEGIIDLYYLPGNKVKKFSWTGGIQMFKSMEHDTTEDMSEEHSGSKGIEKLGECSY